MELLHKQQCKSTVQAPIIYARKTDVHINSGVERMMRAAEFRCVLNFLKNWEYPCQIMGGVCIGNTLRNVQAIVLYKGKTERILHAIPSLL